MVNLLPVSTLIPTRNRKNSLERLFHSLAQQLTQPLEIIVVDASTDQETKLLCQRFFPKLKAQIRYYRATETGAATQRNQALSYASQHLIWFLDDDILFETEDCLEQLNRALQSNLETGGANAMIVNQKYLPPGKISRLLFFLLHGKAEPSYAGKCIGPGVNLLPEDRDDLPEFVPVEWLNTTCTLYRRDVLPDPPFPALFYGYSLMEDLTLSLLVGKRWKLVNVRTAKIFHDSQPGDHKSSPATLAEMELINRHFVMTQILGRTGVLNYGKLALWELFQITACLATPKQWNALPAILIGKISGLWKMLVSSWEYQSPAKIKKDFSHGA